LVTEEITDSHALALSEKIGDETLQKSNRRGLAFTLQPADVFRRQRLRGAELSGQKIWMLG